MDAKEKNKKKAPLPATAREEMWPDRGAVLVSVSIGVGGIIQLSKLSAFSQNQELLVKFPITTVYLTNKFQLEKKTINRHVFYH